MIYALDIFMISLNSCNVGKDFEDLFKFNLKLHQAISQLVFRFYNDGKVEFPVKIGEFEGSVFPVEISIS